MPEEIPKNFLKRDEHSSKRHTRALSERVVPGRTSFEAFTVPVFGLAPAEVYRAAEVSSGAGGLLLHRFTFALPLAFASEGPFAFCCTFSGSPQAVVNSRHTLWCPDFPLFSPR